MTINISYMGTKRQLAPHVANIIADGPRGPLLDIFAGISAISSFVAPSRPVWCNDAQLLASSVATAFFVAPGMPPSLAEALRLLQPPYERNKKALEERFSSYLSKERRALTDGKVADIAKAQDVPSIQTSVNLAKERARLRKSPNTFPYRLFSITFAGAYFGMSQAVEIDSIKYAIDILRNSGAIDEDTCRWLNLALCQAVSKVATTTGHFAQCLSIKPSNIRRFTAQRRRSVLSEFSLALSSFRPVRNPVWRKHNKSFHGDAISLLQTLCNKNQERPSIIYADPPYSSDQYSRYYHVYETLLLYDYPESTGAGRYRPDRFTSPFSLSSKVAGAIEDVIALSAQMQARLVMSYPSSGLLADPERSIRSMIKRHYGVRGRIKRLEHWHSSLGASKGFYQHQVQEMIFSVG